MVGSRVAARPDRRLAGRGRLIACARGDSHPAAHLRGARATSGLDRAGPLRRPRRRRRDRAPAVRPLEGQADRPRALGHLGPLPGARRRCSRCTARYVARRLRRRSRRTPGRSSPRPRSECARRPASAEAQHWMDVARLGVRLARQAIDEAGRDGRVRGRVRDLRGGRTRRERRETLELLARVLRATSRPTCPARDADARSATRRRSRPSSCCSRPGSPSGSRSAAAGTASAASTASTGARRRATSSAAPRAGSRRWASARSSSTACRSTTCPGCSRGSATSRACRSACTRTSAISPGRRWRFDERDRPRGLRGARARVAGRGRADHRRLLRHDARAHRRGSRRRSRARKPGRRAAAGRDRSTADEPDAEPPCATVARRPRPRRFSRCPSPSSRSTPGVFVPTPGQLPRLEAPVRDAGPARVSRCLDVGCGCGILAVQLALNGADARARDRHRPQRRREHARERVPQRRRRPRHRRDGRPLPLGARRDRFDLVVASLYQMPVDPYEEPTGHRPLDYWGRNLLDHFLRLLPQLLAPDGDRLRHAALDRRPARRRTRCSREHGLDARVVDFSFFPFGAAVRARTASRSSASSSSPTRTTSRSADEDVMVAYLLEISRA